MAEDDELEAVYMDQGDLVSADWTPADAHAPDSNSCLNDPSLSLDVFRSMLEHERQFPSFDLRGYAAYRCAACLPIPAVGLSHPRCICPVSAPLAHAWCGCAATASASVYVPAPVRPPASVCSDCRQVSDLAPRCRALGVRSWSG